MALLRGKLLSGALFAGALFGATLVEAPEVAADSQLHQGGPDKQVAAAYHVRPADWTPSFVEGQPAVLGMPDTGWAAPAKDPAPSPAPVEPTQAAPAVDPAPVATATVAQVEAQASPDMGQEDEEAALAVMAFLALMDELD